MRTLRRPSKAGAVGAVVPRPAAALSLLLALARPARAQEPGAADTVRIEELVVTATRTAVPQAAVPAAVTVVRGDVLHARGVAHVLDALRALPGIAVVQSGSFGGTTSLFIRGGESDYVQVLVDGVPLNEPGGRADLAHLSTDNIERIEVVRGPASVLYGSDAVGGVIQIFTRGGRGRPHAGAAIRGGSHGTLDYGAEVAGEAGIAGYSFSASRFATDGVYAYNNEYRNDALSGRVRIAPDARTEASLSLRYNDSEFHYPTDGAGNLVDRNAVQLEERVAFSLEVGRHLTERLEARVLATASEIDGAIRDGQDDAADTLGLFAYRSRSDVHRRALDVRANYRVSAAALLTAGVELEDQALPGERLVLSATYFDQRFRDVIQYTPLPPDPAAPNYFNVAEATAAGVELEARLSPLPGLAATVAYTFLDTEVADAGFESGPDAEFVQGRPLVRRPAHAARLDVRYAPRGRGSVDVAVRYVGDRDDLDFSGPSARRTTLPAHVVADLGAALALLRPEGRRPAVSALLRIDNIFDETYEEIVNFPARGRTLLFGARVGAGL